jgi:hypothetical protein
VTVVGVGRRHTKGFAHELGNLLRHFILRGYVFAAVLLAALSKKLFHMEQKADSYGVEHFIKFIHR